MEHVGSLESTKEAQELPEAIAEGNSSFLSNIVGGIVHKIRREKRTTISEVIVAFHPFSSPEAALLLVSTKKSRPLAWSNTGSPRFTDFPSLCACSESSLTNLIGSGFNLLCSQSHSKTECRWTRPEVVISWC